MNDTQKDRIVKKLEYLKLSLREGRPNGPIHLMFDFDVPEEDCLAFQNLGCIIRKQTSPFGEQYTYCTWVALRTTGLAAIKAQRYKSIYLKGNSIDLDAQRNSNYELATVGQIIAFTPVENATNEERMQILENVAPHWDKEWLARVLEKTYKERLAITGQFFAAEIDRLELLEARQGVKA